MKQTRAGRNSRARDAKAEKLDNVIRYLLNQHSFLHEKRIQKLVFLADLQMLQTTGKRLVEADFKPYYHGVYSDDVLLALQSMADLETGIPITAHRPTAGWRYSTFSTSTEYTFSPPLIITSLSRTTMNK